MAKGKVERVLERYAELKTKKEPWLPVYQMVAEYVMSRSLSFNTTKRDPGAFLYDKIFDTGAENANHLMASSLIGALWPNAAKTFKIKPPLELEDKFNNTQEVKDFYSRATKILALKMDHPKAGLATSLEEYMNDQGAYGISGIGAFETDSLEAPVRFKAYDTKSAAVDEDNNGVIDTVYTEFEYTLRQAVQEYGLDNLSAESKKAYMDGKCNDKIKILHAVEPRVDRDPYGFGVQDMPVASIHIEIGKKKILRESGYDEMPIFCSRFWKLVGETYGRSPGMQALPDILEINAIREAYTLAHEKNLDPPLAVYEDSVLGNGVIDTSAGAVTVFSTTGRLGSNQKPFEQLITVGEMQSTITRIAELREIIKNHFFIDRLLDLNNETRMTLGEADMRYEFRGQSLNPVYSRQEIETFSRLVECAFNICLKKGLFGVVPGSEEELAILQDGGEPAYIPDIVLKLIQQGKDVYMVEFISPAARIRKSEELLGVQKTLEITSGIAAQQPQAWDVLDIDAMIKRVSDLTGCPEELVNATDTIKKARDTRQQQQEQMAQMEMAKQGSEAARNAAQAGQMAKAS